MKIKQEEDPYCKKSRTQAGEGPLATRTRSKATIKKEEAPQKKLRMRRDRSTTTAARFLQQETDNTLQEVTIKIEQDQSMELKHHVMTEVTVKEEQDQDQPMDLKNQSMADNNETPDQRNTTLPRRPQCIGPSTPHLLLDLNDSNHYCRVCDKEFQMHYHQHAKSFHKIRFDKVPDINDPNFYCSSCEKCFASKQYFRMHIKRAHQLIAVQHRPKKIPT